MISSWASVWYKSRYIASRTVTLGFVSWTWDANGENETNPEEGARVFSQIRLLVSHLNLSTKHKKKKLLLSCEIRAMRRGFLSRNCWSWWSFFYLARMNLLMAVVMNRLNVQSTMDVQGIKYAPLDTCSWLNCCKHLGSSSYSLHDYSCYAVKVRICCHHLWDLEWIFCDIPIIISRFYLPKYHVH